MDSVSQVCMYCMDYLAQKVSPQAEALVELLARVVGQQTQAAGLHTRKPWSATAHIRWC